MDLKLVVRTPQGARDVAVGLDRDHTVAQLVAALTAHVGLDGAGWQVHREHPWTRLDPDTSVEAAGLRIGDRLTLTPPDQAVSTPPEPSATTDVRVVGGPDAGRLLALSAGRYVVGRDPDNEIVLADPFVSRRHLAVEVGGDGTIEVTDLGSANGTFLYGQPLTEPRPLPHDATPVELGTSLLARPGREGRMLPAVSRNQHGRVVVELRPGEPTTDRSAGLAPQVAVAWEPSKGLLRRGASGPSEAAIEDARRLVAADLREAHPDLAELHARARAWDRRLWERRLAGAGALVVRVGWGEAPATVLYDPPVGAGVDAPAHVTLPAVPVTIDLRRGALVVDAEPEAAAACARAVLAQLVTLLAPIDLAVAVAVPPPDAAVWEWAGWLPHTAPRPDDIDQSLVAGSRQDAAALLRALAAWPSTPDDPVAVVVVAADLAPQAAVLLAHPNVVPILLGRPDPSVDLGAATEVVLHAEDGTLTVRTVPEREQHGHGPDLLSVELASRIATQLAPLVTSDVGSTDGQVVRLVDLLGSTVLSPSDLAVRWATPPSRLETVLGSASGRTVALSLESDGPHVLVDGPTGSGKTELLRTWLGSLAASYPPDRLGIVLVDHHGGGAFGELASLPHVACVLTDLGLGRATRLLAALDAEVRARERLLRDRGATDVAHLRSTDPHAAPPALLVVVDDAVTLHDDRPKVVEQLGRMARKGRQVGIHLVVAGQQVEGRLPDDLLLNSPTRITCERSIATGDTDAVYRAHRQGPRGPVDLQVAQLATTTRPAASGQVTVSDLRAGRVPRASSSTYIASVAPSRTDLQALVGSVREAAGIRGVGEHWTNWLEDRAAARDPGDDTMVRTLMFTDIVGSTDLVEVIGDRAWSALVRWHDQALRREFTAHDGEEVDHAGDGFFVAFASVEEGLQCAVAIQRALDEHRRAHGFAPDVRIGLHAATVTWDDGYRGREVHVAARIGGAAEGGEILATTTTVEAAESTFRTTAVRELQLKGVREPVLVASVVWDP